MMLLYQLRAERDIAADEEVPKAAAAVATVSKVDSADEVTSLTEDREAEDEAYGETAVLKAAAAENIRNHLLRHFFSNFSQKECIVFTNIPRIANAVQCHN